MLLGLIWESEKPLCIDYIFGFFGKNQDDFQVRR